mgnify:CR=1 FL=1
MRKIKALAYVLIALMHSKIHAADLTPEQQNKAYDQCLVPCTRDMATSTFGQALRDKPFVYQAYCSCYCARIALRLTTEQLAVMGKDAVNKGDMFFSPETKAFARRAAEQCYEPLISK